MQLLRLNSCDHRMFTQIRKLPVECLFYFFVGNELTAGLFRKSHLFSGHPALSLIQCIFQRTSEIHINSSRPLPGLPIMGHYTSAVVPVPGVFRLIPRVDQHLVSYAVIVDRRESGTLAHQVCNSRHKLLRTVRLNPHAQARLMSLDLFRRLQRHITQFIYCIEAFPGLSAHSQILELIVSGKIIRCVCRDRPHPF